MVSPFFAGTSLNVDIAALDSLQIVLDRVGQAGVALALMLVMFSVALGLRVDDFSFLRNRPLLFLGGVFSQIVILPLVTFLPKPWWPAVRAGPCPIC